MPAGITYLGHSTFQFTLPDERVVLVDPWLTENPACPEALKKPPRCDYIFLTHGHFDHVGDVQALVEAFNPLVVGNFELCGVLEKQIGKGRYSGMNTGGTQTVDGMRVSLTQAFHSSGYLSSSSGDIVYAGMPNGLVIAPQGLAAVYHAGDTDVFSDMQLISKLFAPKIAILPIGDHFTMGAQGAAMAAEFIDPAVIIPCHYKTFPILAQSADDFRTALSPERRDRLVVPQVGRALSWMAEGVD